MARFSAKKKRQFVRLLSEGTRRTVAAKEVGIDYKTFRNHYHADSDFADEVEEAEMNVDDQVVDALFEAALSGNVTACQVWLYNRRPEDWADKRQQKVEVGGPGGGPIRTENTVHMPDAQTWAEIMAIREQIGDTGPNSNGYSDQPAH